MGLELPPFQGPLTAFVMGERQSPGDPIYLGGDLHTTHPDDTEQRPGGERDPTLDAATIIVSDLAHEILEVAAVEGIWCLALEGDLADSTPYLTIIDSQARLRVWQLIPPARLMIGAAHFWLPSVPPPFGR